MNKKTTPEISKMLEFIQNNGLSYSIIATYIGISQGNFSEKVKGARYSKFTEPQKEKIYEYLNGLSKEINLLN